MWKSNWMVIGTVVLVIGLSGCTRASIRKAIETQQRANEVQQAVFERQHDAVRVLMYRDVVAKLEAARGGPLAEAERAVINEAWNDRDLVEFWAVQQERARALRLVGVDSVLYSRQSIVDLLYKELRQTVKRGVAAAAGARVGEAGD